MSESNNFDYWSKELQLQPIGPICVYGLKGPFKRELIGSAASVSKAWKNREKLIAQQRFSSNILILGKCKNSPIGFFGLQNIFHYYKAKSLEIALRWFHVTEAAQNNMHQDLCTTVEMISKEAAYLLESLQHAPFKGSQKELQQFFLSKWSEAIEQVLTPQVNIFSAESRHRISNCLWVVACRELQLAHNNEIHKGFNIAFM